MANHDNGAGFFKNIFLVFIPLLLLYSLSYFQRTAIPGTIFNQLQGEFGFSAVKIAGLSATFMYVYSIFQIISGMLADKYGGMRMVLPGGLLLGIGALLFPLTGDLWLLYLARLLAALGASTLYLSLMRETDRIFGHKNYALMLGVCYFVGYGGGMLGTWPLAAAMEFFSWQSILIAVAAAIIIFYALFLCGFKFVQLPKIGASNISLRSLVGIMKNPYSWMLSFCSTVCFSTYFIIQTVFGKKLLEDVAGMSSSRAALVVLLLTVVCMTVIFLSGLLSKLIHNRHRKLMRFAIWCYFLTTVVTAAVFHFGLPGYILIICYLFYAAASGFTLIFAVAMQEINCRENMILSAGFINCLNYLAVALFSVLVGLLLDSIGGKMIDGVVVYSYNAYRTLFDLLLIPGGLALAVSYFLPETGGHFCRIAIADAPVLK